mgnify:CR=1 FL=1|jgi:hypothetical protein
MGLEELKETWLVLDEQLKKKSLNEWMIWEMLERTADKALTKFHTR